MLDDYRPKPPALWIAALIFLALVLWDSWFRWSTFQLGTLDLAYYTQGIWLAAHGHWQVSLLEMPMMGNHAEPICFLLVPFFWIWPQPMCLVFLQTLLLATMPFTAYRIARRLEFERRGALWMGLATLLAPATGFIALHEFHPEALAAPFILLMLEARQARRPGSFWVFFLLAVLCKENVAVLLVWFCAVHWMLDRERGREWQTTFNLLPGGFALAWVLAYFFWLGPGWSGGRVDHLQTYSHLGASGGEIAGKMASSPLETSKALWNGITGGNLVWGLMLPFLLLPLLRLRWLVISIPIFAQHLLSWRPQEWSIDYHYAAPILPLLWMGAAEAAANMFWRDVMARWVAVACAISQIWFGPGRAIAERLPGIRAKLAEREVQREMLALLPPDGSVMAGFPYLSHLAKREQLHSLHFTLKGSGTGGGLGYPAQLPEAILMNVDDVATFDREPRHYHPAGRAPDGTATPDSEVLLHRYLLASGWQRYAKNSFTVFLKGEGPKRENPVGEGPKLDGSHTLAGIERLPGNAPGTLKLLFTWELGTDRTFLPWARLDLIGAGGRQWEIKKGPVALGLEGGRYQEEWLLAPTLPPGKYQGQVVIYDNHENRREQAPEAQLKSRRFALDEIAL